MAKVGYIRVSTEEQDTARQREFMSKNQVKKIFEEKCSGKSTENREELRKMLEYCREGDTLFIESISRLARSVRDFLKLVDELTANGVQLISGKENIDTTTPQGKFMLTVFAALAELEREQILQRQREGIEIAKREGKYKGRKKIDAPDNFEEVYKSWKAGTMTARKAMEILGMLPNTFYRRVKEFEER